MKPSAANRHEWDHGYPFSKCKRCAALDLGSTYKTPCRGWYYQDGEKVYVEAAR